MPNRAIFLVFFLLSMFILSGCSAKTNAEQDISGTSVKVAKAVKGRIETSVSISGRLSAISEATIVPKASGRVESIPVTVGSSVKTGDLLIQLERSDYVSQVNAAEAALEMAQSRLVIYIDPALQEPASVRQAKLALDLARTNYERVKNLQAEGAVSQSQVEAAQSQVMAAEMGYEAAIQQYEMAKAQVKQARAALDQAESLLSNTSIVSPIDGIVSAININVGEMASPGVPVATVVDSSKVKCNISVSENYINIIKPGQTLEVSISSTEQPLSGQVQSVSPSADTRTKDYPVELLLDNPSGELKPGMFARVRLPVDSNDDAIIIPKESLVDRGGYNIVFVVEDGKCKETRVSLGIVNSSQAEITDGIEVGDSVVIVGQDSLADGAAVTVVE